MGRLTDDMTRLVGEIHASRDDRGRLLRDLKLATVDMKRTVAGMQAGFHSHRADMVQRQQRMLRGFVSGLRATVGGLRKECADDIAGAYKAWAGTAAVPATPGRTRRGGKGLGSESA
jgi:hypothetical protein